MTSISTIGALAKDLVTKIDALSSYGGRVAVTLGGTEADATLANLETPNAWVVFDRSQNTGKEGQRWSEVRFTFAVVVALPYSKGESDFTDIQLKLIEDTTQAVSGTPSTPNGSNLWIFDSSSLLSVDPNKVHYELRFSTVGAYAKQLT
jgi:hypothetical protein